MRKFRFQRMLKSTAFVAYFDYYKNDFQSSRGFLNHGGGHGDALTMSQFLQHTLL